MIPTGPACGDSGSSETMSDTSKIEYYISSSSNEMRRGSVAPSTKAKPRGTRWLNHVKDWLSVSEPSAQAMKQQKRNAYKRHGVDFKDPQAAAKMHLPIGKVPNGAITSTSGPNPEEALKKAFKDKQMRQSVSGCSQTSRSVSSSIFASSRSSKEVNPVTPWET